MSPQGLTNNKTKHLDGCLASSTSSLNICFLKRHLERTGGLEKYTRFLSKAFANLGHNVTLLSSEKHLSIDPSIKVEKISPSYSLTSFDKACQKWLKNHPSDLIFGMDRASYQTHIRAGNGVHRAFLERKREIDPWFKRHTYFLNSSHRTILQMEKRSFEHPDLQILFTNSYMVKKEILTFYNTDPEKIQVVHNGVEYEALESPFNAWQTTRSKIAARNDVHELLFIGNGYMRKGLLPFLYALSKIKHLPFHLTVIGKDKNIPFYQKKAFELKIEKKVSFLGEQPNITAFYALADTLVIPSYYDPFANVTVEGMAMGVFVLSSKHNGGSEILTPINGSIIPSLSDIDAFSQILENRLKERKTEESAKKIRESISHLDFKHQLAKITSACLL